MSRSNPMHHNLAEDFSGRYTLGTASAKPQPRKEPAVINVTLSFTSVADALAALAKLDGANATLEAQPAPKSEKQAKKSAPAPVEAVAPTPATAAPEEAPAPAVVAEPTPLPEVEALAAPQVSYADLQKAVLALYKIDKAKAAAIAHGMGFDSFKVMPAERWAEALELVNANLKG